MDKLTVVIIALLVGLAAVLQVVIWRMKPPKATEPLGPAPRPDDFSLLSSREFQRDVLGFVGGMLKWAAFAAVAILIIAVGVRLGR